VTSAAWSTWTAAEEEVLLFPQIKRRQASNQEGVQRGNGLEVGTHGRCLAARYLRPPYALELTNPQSFGVSDVSHYLSRPVLSFQQQNGQKKVGCIRDCAQKQRE